MQGRPKRRSGTRFRRRAHRVLRRIATLSQSLDHPVLPAIPETEYLKGYAFEIAR